MKRHFDSWEDSFFFWTLVISLGIHGVVVSYLFFKKFNLISRRKQIEVVYQKNQPIREKVKKDVEQQVQVIKKEPVVKQIEILSKKSENMPSFLDSKSSMEKGETPMKIGKKENPILKTESLERQISIPVLESGKISNPSYLQYNEAVRAKIRYSVYKYVNSPDLTKGEVYLSFILAADGSLKDVKVLESRTTASKSLCDIALKSIREVGSFGVFPTQLKYQELPFNIVISFQVNR